MEQKTVETISISGAWALYPLVVRWAEEYMESRANIKFEISAGGAGKGMMDVLSGMVDIAMVSRNIYPEEIAKGAWYIPVAVDAVVPVINASNPCLVQLQETGISGSELKDIWITGGITKWSDILDTDIPNEIYVYTRSDACGAAQTWAEFLYGNQEDLLGIAVYGDPGLSESVHNDRFGIGYNNINYAFDPVTHLPVEGLALVPIDLNGNNVIDEVENFYTTQEELNNAIRNGLYPSPPSRQLYLVFKEKPQQKTLYEFAVWILTDGRLYVEDSGYINIKDIEIREALSKLN